MPTFVTGSRLDRPYLVLLNLVGVRLEAKVRNRDAMNSYQMEIISS